MKTYSGSYNGNGLKVGIVVARFNDFVTTKLLNGAIDTLKRNGVSDEDIEVTWVPGAFEIPLVTQLLAKKQQYDGLIALGAVIRGETSHFDYVCNGVSTGIANVNLKIETPVMFGVLTTDTIEQAMNRAGLKGGNKGSDCALSLLEMVNLKKRIFEK
ncbi:6,7-dimethyl-8-ribityllumazine synthase [Companilactobacillus sp. FL22-1]|uniref:6,7-dimethyl-8-ribityllumazine synthase n=1 Tax=Companilactobacillus sp. FL22-1 TaxID=3373892 RepID=UPI00375538A8